MEGDVLLAQQQAVGIKELLTVVFFIFVGMLTLVGFLGRMLINRIIEQFKAQFDDHQGRLDALEEAFESRIEGHSERVSRLEEQGRRAPTHEDLSRIYDKVNSVQASNARIEGKVEGINESLRAVVNKMMGSHQ